MCAGSICSIAITGGFIIGLSSPRAVYHAAVMNTLDEGEVGENSTFVRHRPTCPFHSQRSSPISGGVLPQYAKIAAPSAVAGSVLLVGIAASQSRTCTVVPVTDNT